MRHLRESKPLGSFILVDRFSNATVAIGMLRHSLRRAQNVHRQALSINREAHEKLNGHRGKVIWLTGLRLRQIDHRQMRWKLPCMPKENAPTCSMATMYARG